MSRSTVKKEIIERVIVYRAESSQATALDLLTKYFEKGYRCVYQGWTRRGSKPGKTYKMIFERKKQ